MESYLAIKNDMRSLIEVTVSYGNSVGGGFGRTCVEYHIVPTEIDCEPNYLSKFQACVALLALRKEYSLLPDEDVKQLAMYTLAKVSKIEISDMDRFSVKSLLDDAREIFRENFHIISVVFEKSI